MALSDGVFAIAITLMVLQLTVPDLSRGELTQLSSRLLALWPKYLSYAISFVVVFSYWLTHRNIFQHVRRADSVLVVLNGALLFLIAFQPFPTGVLGTYGDQRASVILFAGTLAGTGVVILTLWLYATHNRRLVHPELDAIVIRNHTLRAVSAPSVFLASMVIALASPLVAELSWLLLGAILIALRSQLKRRQRE